MGKLSAESSREAREPKSKKSKKNKENKVKSGHSSAIESIPNLPPDPDNVDINKLIEKQQEACNVIEQKKNVLASNQLTYLEYLEMQEEIGRLYNVRDEFQAKINALRKHRKRQETGSGR